MKKFTGLFLFLILVMATSSYAQLPNNSWSLNFGLGWPRFVNTGQITAGNANFAGHIGVQRNFSEHVGLNMQIEFASLQGVLDWGTYSSVNKSMRNNAFSANFDMLYYFVPCESVSPYLTFGAGPVFYMLDSNRPNKAIPDNNFTYQLNAGVGVDWSLDDEWKLRTEMNYHSVMDNKFDGVDGPSYGGILGGPFVSYLALTVGLNYTFEKGEPSKYCQLYSGIAPEMKDMTDYNRIEEMIKAHIPKEVVKEVAVPSSAPAMEDKWVLVGVNFDFNKSTFKVESYPILYDAAKTLLKHPDLKVTIEGYTDNIGSESYNKKLSQKRADAVKDYLVGKGVAASRLSAVGLGESNPVGDNKTADGRAMNRRIEFKVQ